MSKLQCYTFLFHFLIFLLLNIFHEYLLKNLIYFMDNIIWEEFKKIVILRIKVNMYVFNLLPGFLHHPIIYF